MDNYFNKVLAALAMLAFMLSLSACGPNNAPSESDGAVSLTDSSSELQIITSKIEADPSNHNLLYQRAGIYVMQKSFKEALEDINSAINLDSSVADYFTTKADVYYASNQIYNARDALIKAIQLNPENNKARLKLAEIYLIVKDHNESVRMLNKILETDNSNLTAYFMRGMNYKEVGDTAKAIIDFQKIVDLEPSYYNAHMQLGVIFQAQNNPVASAYYENALSINPSSEEALYGHGLWFQDHGDLNIAIQDYTTITTINPSNKNAHFNLGYIHQVELKIYDVAITHYSDALKADPQYAEAYFNRGLCYENLGDVQAAFADYQAAAAIRPDYKGAREGMDRVGN